MKNMRNINDGRSHGGDKKLWNLREWWIYNLRQLYVISWRRIYKFCLWCSPKKHDTFNRSIVKYYFHYLRFSFTNFISINFEDHKRCFISKDKSCEIWKIQLLEEPPSLSIYIAWFCQTMRPIHDNSLDKYNTKLLWMFQ